MAKNEILENLKTNKSEVKVFLSNKTMLSGKVTGFDDDVVIIDKAICFKWQIISIVPN